MTLAHGAAGLFAGAAAIGSYLGKEVLEGKETRKGLALLHGPLAASGLILLIVSAIRERRRELFLPISLFTAAALGGGYLFSRDISGKRPQRVVTIAHGSLALTAFGFLVKQLITPRPQVLESGARLRMGIFSPIEITSSFAIRNTSSFLETLRLSISRLCSTLHLS